MKTPHIYISSIPEAVVATSRAIRSLAVAVVAALLLVGCSSIERYNDAVRIKPQREATYRRTPNSDLTRDGRTLRGTVSQVVITPRPGAPGELDTSLIFLDASAEDKPENYERVPLHDVERIGSLMNLPIDTVYDNINVVESFNNTEQIPMLRRVPVRNYSQYFDNGGPGGSNQSCNCLPLDFSFPFPELECPKREYQFLFLELRGLYSTFNDRPTRTTEQGRDAFQGEVAAGVRFGGSKEWGAGVAYTTGLPVYNSFTGADLVHPMALVHLRYQAPGPVTSLLGFCMKPFIYAQGGLALDDATFNLIKFNASSSEDCGTCGEVVRDLAASGELGEVDISMPVSFGIGIGADFPILPFLDVSADIGWRSIGFGENANLGGWVVPSQRRVHAFFLRAGVTF